MLSPKYPNICSFKMLQPEWIELCFTKLFCRATKTSFTEKISHKTLVKNKIERSIKVLINNNYYYERICSQH